jgi:multiple sugar transport system ATP-binding protein
LSKPEIARKVNSTAEGLELSLLLDRRPFALSGGQRQRVALGRAIVREPKVFLLDEPLSNLDAALRATTRNELVKLHQRIRTTMIYVTHDQVEAMTMGTRICIMSAGRIVQIGHPMEVYRDPVNTFVARFLGSPAMNLFPAGIGGDIISIGDQSLSRPAAYRGVVPTDRVILGIRPEDIVLRSAGQGALQAQVVTVAPLGAETQLSLTLAGVEPEVVVRAPRDTSCEPGQTVRFDLDASSTRLFDAATEERLPTVAATANR